MTRDDFFDVYAHGTEIRISYSYEDAIIPYDVGFTDDPSRKSFSIPDTDYFTAVWTVMDPGATPFGDTFPAATHVLVLDDDPEVGGSVYQFYSFRDERIIFEGVVEVEDGGPGPVEDRYNSIVGLFPLTPEMAFEFNGTWYFEDEDDIDPQDPFPALVRVGGHGIGDFEKADGETVEVAAFYDDVIIFDPESEPGSDDEVFDWDVYYSIIAQDGTWLYFSVVPPPGHEDGEDVELQGDVFIEDIEYWEIVPPTSVAGEGAPSRTAPWSIFPNPTTDVIRFSEPLTATVFDMMGRAVREAREAREVDLRGLASGTYVVRSEAGRSRTVTVRR